LTQFGNKLWKHISSIKLIYNNLYVTLTDIFLYLFILEFIRFVHKFLAMFRCCWNSRCI